jgi:hypothetical protein
MARSSDAESGVMNEEVQEVQEVQEVSLESRFSSMERENEHFGNPSTNTSDTSCTSSADEFAQMLAAIASDVTNLCVCGKWVVIVKGSFTVVGRIFAADREGDFAIWTGLEWKDARSRILGRKSEVSAITCQE